MRAVAAVRAQGLVLLVQHLATRSRVLLSTVDSVHGRLWWRSRASHARRQEVVGKQALAVGNVAAGYLQSAEQTGASAGLVGKPQCSGRARDGRIGGADGHLAAGCQRAT